MVESPSPFQGRLSKAAAILPCSPASVGMSALTVSSIGDLNPWAPIKPLSACVLQSKTGDGFMLLLMSAMPHCPLIGFSASSSFPYPSVSLLNTQDGFSSPVWTLDDRPSVILDSGLDLDFTHFTADPTFLTSLSSPPLRRIQT